MTLSHPATILTAFVVGVFVGAGLWLALIGCVAFTVAWRVWANPSPPVRSFVKHIHHFGPRPHDKGR